MTLRLWAVLALSVTACGGNTSPARQPTNLVLDPSDVGTGASRSPELRVPINMVPEVFESLFADAIERGISLVTYPEMRDVEIGIVRVPPDTLEPNMYRFRVQAVEPLAQRWYAVRADLTAVADSYTSADVAPLDVSDGGSHILVHRFYSGSLPLLTARAAEEPSGDGEHTNLRVILTLTEPTQLVPRASLDDIVAISADGSPGGCVLSSASGANGALQIGEVDFVCAGIHSDQRLGVSVMPGIVSPAGVVLRDRSGSETPTITWTPQTDGAEAPSTLDPAFVERTNVVAMP